MKKEAINHIPKSHMAYAMDENTLHIYLQTAKKDVKFVELIIGDPFDWQHVDQTYRWCHQILKMKIRYETKLHDYYFVSVKLPFSRAKYSFIINDGASEYFYGSRDLVKLDDQTKTHFSENLFGFFNYPYINQNDLYRAPDWVKDTIWYQIFPDRFSRADENQNLALEETYFSTKDIGNFKFGGTLQGIIKRIPYLKTLGINGIYLTPIFKAYSSHKYDTEDYYKVDPAFGSNEDLKMLVDICHQNDIKIMLDAVFNHCGYEHPFFQDVLINKKASPYWDWFIIDEAAFEKQDLNPKTRPDYRHHYYRPSYRTFAFSPVMPKWNIDNPKTESYLIDIGKYWVEHYNIDGWRLDVSNEVSHRFWRHFRETLKSIKPDLYILGENWDDSKPWLQGDQFDAVMNYELSYRIWDLLDKDKSSLNYKISNLINDIDKLLFSYPDNILPYMFNMLGSHDTKRFLVRCNQNKDIFKLFYMFLFIFSGSPMIYYGDEIGLGETRDKDFRRPMIWDDRQDKDMLSFFQTMIKIRRENKDLKQVDIEWVKRGQKYLVLKKEKGIFMMNLSADDVTIRLPSSFKNVHGIDLFKGCKTTLKQSKKLSPYQFFLFKI